MIQKKIVLNGLIHLMKKIEIISDVDENKIHAKFENGIICIKIPKKNKVINEKIIDIK